MPRKSTDTFETDSPTLLLALERVGVRSRPKMKTSRPRVVLAEDDEELRKLLTARLRAGGFVVTPCANGVELLDELSEMLDRGRELEFDLIISDVRMPGLSGLEVLDGLRDLGHRVPIVLITAFGSDDLHARARRLGATAVYDKPLDIDELVDEASTLV